MSSKLNLHNYNLSCYTQHHCDFSDYIEILTRVQVEMEMLENACRNPMDRAKRQADTEVVEIPSTILYKALDESVPRIMEVYIKHLR